MPFDGAISIDGNRQTGGPNSPLAPDICFRDVFLRDDGDTPIQSSSLSVQMSPFQSVLLRKEPLV